MDFEYAIKVKYLEEVEITCIIQGQSNHISFKELFHMAEIKSENLTSKEWPERCKAKKVGTEPGNVSVHQKLGNR